MRISSMIIAFWIFLALPKCSWLYRGVISDLDDESFEMLIAGGYQSDYAVLGRHIVSIRTIDKIRYNGDNHFCTGIVISRRAILTAAHCLTDKYKSVMNPRGVLVVFGSSRRIDNFSNFESRRCDRIIIHPNYKRYMKNDLAIIRLTEVIPHNLRNVSPLPRRALLNVTEGLACITMGWGQVYSHGPYSNDILFLDVVIARHEHCEKFLKHYDREGNLCVAPEAEGEVCPGDLGGPLMCKDTLAGVIGGTQVCEGVQAIKFVNFSHYKDWVYNTITGIVDGTLSIQFGEKRLLLIYFQLFIALVSGN